MDYLKILNQHNNTVGKKVEPPKNKTIQHINPVPKKEPENPKDINTITRVSIVVSTDHLILPVLEVNSIIDNIGMNIEIVNVFILHSKSIDFSNKLANIKHNNVITKRVFNLNDFNINLIEGLIKDDSEYIVYSYADYVLEDNVYLKKSIELMSIRKDIVKVDSSFVNSEYSKLNSYISNNAGIEYKTYTPNNLAIQDPIKKSRTINISNFKGFDLVPCVFKKSAMDHIFNDNIKFYDLNAIMVSKNFVSVKIEGFGPVPKICSNNLKVSFVMQAFLGDYPGSRSNPVDKFHRAMLTTLMNKNIEVIVVSDGCEIVDKEIQEYLNDKRVKYAFVSKSNLRMYEGGEGNVFYRGVPRQVGIELATGDIITYMDSDDILAPNASEIITKEFYNTGIKHMLNLSWFDEISAIEYHKKNPSHYTNDQNILRLDSIKFIESGVIPGFVNWAPWLHAHTSDLDLRWKDVQGSVSEDVVFGRQLGQKAIGKNTIIQKPYYVRCHLRGYFDV